jgi:hypothetical protein
MKLSNSISVYLLLVLFITGIEESIIAQVEYSGKPGKFVNLLKLTAAGNGYSDQTIVIFIPEATPGFDPQFDAYKLPGSQAAPQLYSIIPGINLAVNALPEILINLVVQLGFKVGATNNYSITATEMNSFDPSVTIYLDDTKDGVLIDLKSNPAYSFLATPDDPVQRFKLYFRYPVYLDLKVFMQGVFNGMEMSTHLNQAGLLPLNQPYNLSPWNYNGTESVTAIPNSDIVDWVLVEIRDTTEAAYAHANTSVERKAGFILKNGSVVDTNGISLLSFKQTINENMYVALWHRNHLGVISSSSPVEIAGTYFYDFTTEADKAYGGINAQKEIAEGVFGMIGGDINTDGYVNESDGTSWIPEAGLPGYKKSDANLDGQSDNKDKNDIWFFNLGSDCQVPE